MPNAIQRHLFFVTIIVVVTAQRCRSSYCCCVLVPMLTSANAQFDRRVKLFIRCLCYGLDLLYLMCWKVCLFMAHKLSAPASHTHTLVSLHTCAHVCSGVWFFRDFVSTICDTGNSWAHSSMCCCFALDCVENWKTGVYDQFSPPLHLPLSHSLCPSFTSWAAAGRKLWIRIDFGITIAENCSWVVKHRFSIEKAQR